jgi:hypothetical protein
VYKPKRVVLTLTSPFEVIAQMWLALFSKSLHEITLTFTLYRSSIVCLSKVNITTKNLDNFLLNASVTTLVFPEW